jgi:hypothetical protein
MIVANTPLMSRDMANGKVVYIPEALSLKITARSLIIAGRIIIVKKEQNKDTENMEATVAETPASSC